MMARQKQTMERNRIATKKAVSAINVHIDDFEDYNIQSCPYTLFFILMMGIWQRMY